MPKDIEKTWLWQYYSEIKKGNIIAGQELKMELANLIKDFDNPRYYYDTTEADRRIDFMQNCIKLTKSPFYGKPMILMLWQKAFIEAVYSFKMSDSGFDRFKKILLLISRKNCKSETASALGLCELFFGNNGSDIVCSSNDDAQASIVYDAIDTMRLMIDPLEQDTHRNQRFIKCNFTNSKIFKISDRTRNKEGRNIDFAIIDETHEMKNNIIAKSIEQSQSLKDNPKFINITTEGFVNNGFLDDELEKARKIIKGEDSGTMAERTLPWLYTQDSEHEVWTDEKSWQKSNPSLGIVKKWDYLKEQLDLARKSKSDRMFVLSKDFNFKQNNSQAWLNTEDYQYNATYDIEQFRGRICLGAVDLAETTDLTSAKIMLMLPDDKTKYVYSHYWIPQSKLETASDENSGAKYIEWAKAGFLTICDDNYVDLATVADWFLELYQKYDIKLYKCGYDVKFSKEFIKRMEDYNFDCEIVQQNRFVMSTPMKVVEADLKSRYINYNNNPIDAWCLGNAAMQIDSLGRVMCVKTNNMNSKRIDGAITLIILYEMFSRYRSDFLQLNK